MTKEVQVTCPCCEARLEVDVLTARVLRWREAGAGGPSGRPSAGDFDAMAKRVEGRLGSAQDKFDENLAREKRRGKDLDDLFRRANEKLSRGEDED